MSSIQDSLDLGDQVLDPPKTAYESIDCVRPSPSAGLPQPDPNDVPDPEEFALAQERFGQRPKKDLACYLEAYIEMCEDEDMEPLPPMFRLFQSHYKKDLLYFAAKINDFARFLEKFFHNGIAALDLRFNRLEHLLPLCDLLKTSTVMIFLNLMHNPLSDFAVSSLKLAAVHSRCLVSLCLSGVKLSSYAGLEIAALLNNVPTLRYLNLTNCGIKLEALVTMMTSIKSNAHHLEALDITNPSFPDRASRLVFLDQCCAMLINCRFLKELHLGDISVDDFGLERLLPGLERNKSVKYLDFHGNKLNRDGARMLMRLLETNKVLEVLDLDGNHLTDEGAEYLANSLYEDCSLVTLSIRFCDLTDVGMQFLAKGITRGRVLERIYLWQGKSLRGEGCKALADLMKERRIEDQNTDVRLYEVDNLWQMAENGNGGLRRYHTYTPNFGEYSHKLCYEGFVEPEPQAYWKPSS